MRRYVKRLLRPIARHFLKPQWTFSQYRPRPLTVPPAYRAERPPRDPPSVAIVTPAYNHAAFIRATIDSVLSQNYPRLRYIVKDAGSADGTRDILTSYGSRLNWLSEPDAGQANAINTGFRHVGGDIMGWLNSDDLLLPGALNYIARFFHAHPEIDLVYGDRIVIDRGGAETGRVVLPAYDADVLRYMDYVPQETLFWRRHVWEALGGLDESFQFALDWDFLLRAQGKGFRLRHLPRFLGAFRVYPEQKIHAWSSIGDREQERLRATWIGPEADRENVDRAVRRHIIRSAACYHLHRLGLLRFRSSAP